MPRLRVALSAALCYGTVDAAWCCAVVWHMARGAPAPVTVTMRRQHLTVCDSINRRDRWSILAPCLCPGGSFCCWFLVLLSKCIVATCRQYGLHAGGSRGRRPAPYCSTRSTLPEMKGDCPPKLSEWSPWLTWVLLILPRRGQSGTQISASSVHHVLRLLDVLGPVWLVPGQRDTHVTWLCLHWWGLTAQFYPTPLPQLGIVAHNPGPLCSGELSPFLAGCSTHAGLSEPTWCRGYRTG